MARRPTIRDLAEAAGVSIATVNRVLGGATNVREATVERVRNAARSIGFYGLGSIQYRIASTRPKYHLGFLLQQPKRPFYRNLAEALTSAASRMSDCDVTARIEFLDELTPQNIASEMMKLAEVCGAVGVVAAVHPLVTQTVEILRQRGVPVFALISQLGSVAQAHYVGLDNWKVGRTAG